MPTVHPTTAGSSGIDTERLRDIAVDALLDAGFRPERPTVLLDVPLHRNVGDSLITLGEYQLVRAMRRMGTSLHHVGSQLDDLNATLSRIPKGANILLQGGGNFGDYWPKEHNYRLKVTALASSLGPVIWLPQSVWFVDEGGDIARDTQQVLDSYHPGVLIRDDDSLIRYSRIFGRDAIVCPDLGMCANVPFRHTQPGTSMQLMRRDKESTSGSPTGSSVDWTDVPYSGALRSLAKGLSWKLSRRPPDSALRRSKRAERTAFESLARSRVRSGLDLLGEAETIHTDRLHAAVLALLTGSSATVHDNAYGKVLSVLRTWSDFIDKDKITLVDPSQTRPDA